MTKGIVVEQKFDGIRLQVHKLGNRVAIYTEDKKRDRSTVLPDVVKEVRALPHHSLILDTETVWWEGGEPIPRHAMVGIVVRKKPFVEEDLRLNCFDVLYLNGRDLTDLPWSERQEALKKILPKDGKHLKRVEGRIVSDKEAFLAAMKWAGAYPGSEGAMLKSTWGTYKTVGRAPKTPEWAKVKLTFELKIKVIGIQKKPNPWPAGQKPKSDLTGAEALSAYKHLAEKSRTYLLRGIVGGPGTKSTPIESDHILAPGDLNLRWDAEKATWRGSQHPGLWEMAKGWPNREPGERAYGNTYAKALDPAPKMGDIATVRPILMREERDPKTGKMAYYWMFPRLQELDPERTKPDTTADVKRIVRESGKRTPGRRVQASLAELYTDYPGDPDEWLESQTGWFWSPDEMPRLSFGGTTWEFDEEFEGKRVPLTREEQRLKAEKILGDWYLVQQDKPEKLPFVIQYHLRGIWSRADVKAARKALRGAETQEALDSVWKEFDCELLAGSKDETYAKIKRALQPVDDKRGDVTTALNKFLESVHFTRFVESGQGAAGIPIFESDEWMEFIWETLYGEVQRNCLIQESPHLGELSKVWDRIVNRGNIHEDVRLMDPGGKWLVGWTADVVKIVLQDLNDNLFYPLRDRILENESGDQFLSQKKASQPTVYLRLLTPTKPVYGAEPGEVLATAETAGRLIFAVSGEYANGVHKSDFHEYWLWVSQKKYQHLNGRWDFKLIQPTRELKKAPLEQFWMGLRNWTEKGQKPYVMTHNRAEKERDAKAEGLKGIVWNPSLLKVLEKDPLAATALKGYTGGQIEEKYEEYSANDGIWPKGGPPKVGKAPVGGH